MSRKQAYNDIQKLRAKIGALKTELEKLAPAAFPVGSTIRFAKGTRGGERTFNATIVGVRATNGVIKLRVNNLDTGHARTISMRNNPEPQ